MLQGAAHLVPAHSKWGKHPPMTIDDLKIIRANLNLEDSCDVAVYTCIMVGFYCAARLGELTVPNIWETFNPKKYIMRWDVTKVANQNGLPVLKFHIPITKCEAEGEDVQCAPHPDCITDPKAALLNHLHINSAHPDAHLFAQNHHKGGMHPLTKTQVVSKPTDIAKCQGLADLKGHSLHIEGTLFYLLKGVPFNIVKAIGRWAGNSFTIYLRLHTLILAPYLQLNQQALDEASVNHILLWSVPKYCQAIILSQLGPGWPAIPSKLFCYELL